MPIQLYTANKTRGMFAHWYIKELGLEDAEIIILDYENGEHKLEKYGQINPFHRIPSLVDNSLTLHESGAILLYLAEKYGGLSGLEPRALTTQWLLLGQTTLVEVLLTESERKHQSGTLAALNASLEGKQYLLGSFSAGDVSVGSTLSYVKVALQFDYSPYPAIASYVERIMARSAFKEACQSLLTLKHK